MNVMSVCRRQYDDIFICQCPRSSQNIHLGPRVTRKKYLKILVLIYNTIVEMWFRNYFPVTVSL